MQQVSLDKLVNKKGTTYKALDQAERYALETPISALDVLMAKPSIIKRPIVEDQKIIALGFDEALYEKIFKQL